jgi:hypothetical protein
MSEFFCLARCVCEHAGATMCAIRELLSRKFVRARTVAAIISDTAVVHHTHSYTHAHPPAGPSPRTIRNSQSEAVPGALLPVLLLLYV